MIRDRCFVLKCEFDCDSSIEDEVVIVRVRDVIVMLVPMSQFDALKIIARGH